MAGPTVIQEKEKRIVRAEVEKRAVIKLNKSIKVDADDITIFGVNNDYPQLMEALINGSSNGMACANTYAGFLEGQGFANESLNDVVVGFDARGRQMTLADALSYAASQVAYYQGFYFQVSVNLEGQSEFIKAKPFKNCRFGKPDDSDFAPFVYYYDNWQKDKNNIRGYDPKAHAVKYPIFNTNKDIIAAQKRQLEVGEKWRGQMYYKFFDDRYFYPLSPFDSVYLDLDNDNQIAVYKNRQLRNGFFDKILVRVSPGLRKKIGFGEDVDQNGGGPAGYEVDSIREEIAAFLGADGETVCVIEDDVDTDSGEFIKNTFQIETIAGNVKTNLFVEWEKSSSNAIRKAARNLPAILIDYESSSLGTTSGEAIQQATNFYNEMTDKDRKKLEKSFAELFKTSVIPELANNTDWTIKQLDLWQPQQSLI